MLRSDFRLWFRRAGSAPTPDYTNADIFHVVPVAFIVGGASEGIEKPLVAVSKIDEGLIRDEQFQPRGRSDQSSDIIIVPCDTAA